ncbi:MBL fold metallo-hydrolase [Acinetobacter wuhouensis]|uniref:MBL fold metallo-hydrolase n=1 Tax=Acinetobacter wuhouensis TaxID=1879050 RepID=UPI00083A6CAB|nr:MBL fold metallo-hydrolase [Acinetobacter wuhouensis]AXQ20855.1 MBL fold metallo-hydrolase [Acinetobacter wuhouensis]
MKLKKIVTFSISLIIFLVIATLTFLLQPSGHVQKFQKWIYQPELSSSENNQNNSQNHLDKKQLTVRFFGVSTLLFDDGQTQILIDGFFTRPSLTQTLLKPVQSNPKLLAQIIKDYDLKRVQAVFTSHSHYDHALDIAELGKQLPIKIIGSESTMNIARGGNVAEQQLQLISPLQTMLFGEFKVTAIPSQHTPPTAVNNDLGEVITHPLKQPARFSEFKEGHSFDYLIEHQGYKVLVKASTGVIANQLKNMHVDTLFLGIAQLSRQTPEYQQQYLEKTIGTIKPKTVIPIHWDNFWEPLPLTQPLEFLPYLADNTQKSMQTLFHYVEQQHAKVVILTQPVAYPLQN